MIACFLSNISAKYYKNPSMLSRVIAKNVEGHSVCWWVRYFHLFFLHMRVIVGACMKLILINIWQTKTNRKKFCKAKTKLKLKNNRKTKTRTKK